MVKALLLATTALAIVCGDAAAQTYEVPNLTTTGASFTASRTTFSTSITTTPPAVPNSTVYKDGVGNIMTSSNTTVSNPGTANEGLLVVSASVLNNLTIPTAQAGITPTIGDIVKTASGVVCVRSGGVFRRLDQALVSTSLNLGTLLGVGTASATTCVF
jgi:hypothetical protein